jgi:hypothetical protein
MSNTHAGCNANAITPSDASSTLDYLPFYWEETVFTFIHVPLHVMTSFSVIVHVVLQTTVVQPQSLHYYMHATVASEMCLVTVCTCQAPICLAAELGTIHVLLMHPVHPVHTVCIMCSFCTPSMHLVQCVHHACAPCACCVLCFTCS